VIIEHRLSTLSTEFVTTVMGHLRNNIQVAVGKAVIKSQLIGYLGNSSENGGWIPHMHLGVHKGTYAGDYALACDGNWVYSGYTKENSTYVKND
jgi:murein DD-endopeptidase MepM/ murein hydrolase activator NlpD